MAGRGGEETDTMAVMERYISAVNGKIRSDRAVFYTGKVDGLATFKALKAARVAAFRAARITEKDAGSLEMVTDVIARIPLPAALRYTGYKSLGEFMDRAAKDGHVTRQELTDLWSQVSAAFSKNSNAVLAVAGSQAKLHSDFHDVELLNARFWSSSLPREKREKIAAIIAKKKKVDKEIEEEDRAIYKLFKKSEAALKRYNLTLDLSKFAH